MNSSMFRLMFAALGAAAGLEIAVSPALAAGPPLYGFMKGEKIFADEIQVGGTEKKTGLRGDGVTTYIVHLSGTGTTPGGRAVDALYTFRDAHSPFPLPQQNRMIRLLTGASGTYRDFRFWAPLVTDTHPAYREDHEYDFLWRPEPGEEISVVAPATRWTNPAEDVLSGSYKVAIYRAIESDGKVPAATTLHLIDARQFQDAPTPLFPLLQEPAPLTAERLMTDYPSIRGVAADGVSLVLLRSVSEAPGKARFSVSMRAGGAGRTFGAGALYPLVGDAFRSAGTLAVEVPTRKVGKNQHVAFALYRPPDAFGTGRKRQLTFTVEYEGPAPGSPGPKEERTIDLIRPPVILVHGTYDNPDYCYRQIDPIDDAEQSLYDWLKLFDFDHVYCLDWKEWNGSKDPSDFVTNERRLFDGAGGIREALVNMRDDGLAVTRADVVCHSQGGVIARAYARGYSLQRPPVRLAADHPHFTDPRKCRAQGCWYHRTDNFDAGDLHRLITISTTHRGSAVCNLFVAFEEYQKASPLAPETYHAMHGSILGLFQTVVDKKISGITTGGFYNQVPGSPELRALGPTPVPSHAIAAYCTDEEMKTVRPDDFSVSFGLTYNLGNYFGKMFLVRSLTPDRVQMYAMEQIAAKALDDPQVPVATRNKLQELARQFRTRLEAYRQGPNNNEANAELIFLIRQIVFRGDDNDCTVAVQSSLGGLEAPFATRVPHTLHGWAPRSRQVQEKVKDLLCDDGGALDPNGFPDAYSGERTKAAGFFVPPAAPPVQAVNAVPVSQEPAAQPRPTAAPAESAAAQWDAGMKVFLQGKADEAFQLLRAAIRLDPTNAARRTEFAFYLSVNGRGGEALEEYRAAATSEPANPVYRDNFGESLLANGRHAEAEAEFLAVRRLAPTDARAASGLGQALSWQKKFHEAEPLLREAIRLDPQNGRYPVVLADSLNFAGRAKEAEPYYLAGLRLNPYDASAYDGLAVAYLALGRVFEAEQAALNATRMNPGSANAHANLAAAQWRLGHKDQALQSAQTARRLGLASHPVFQALNLR